MKSKYKQFYMRIAVQVAELSSATRLKVGSIAVKNKRIIAEGYNGTPIGWDNNCEDENNKTYPWTLHSEQNLLAKLSKSNESSKNCVVFITHMPCMECSKILYNSGVKKVYYLNEYRISDGIDFLKKCGVKVEQLNLD